MDMIHLDRTIISRGKELITFDQFGDQKGKPFPRGSERTLKRLSEELQYYCDLYNRQSEGVQNHTAIIDFVRKIASWLVPTTELLKTCWVVFRKERDFENSPDGKGVVYADDPLTLAEAVFLEDAKMVIELMRKLAVAVIEQPGQSLVPYDEAEMRNVRQLRLQLSLRLSDIGIRLFVEADGKNANLKPWHKLHARALREYSKALTELAKDYEGADAS